MLDAEPLQREAVAVNVTAESPVTVAVTVFVPALDPSVRVTVALPLAFVLLVAADRLPPPAVTAHATLTPDRAAELLFKTVTSNAVESVALKAPVWLLPAETAMLAGVVELAPLVLVVVLPDAAWARRVIELLPSGLQPGITAMAQIRSKETPSTEPKGAWALFKS